MDILPEFASDLRALTSTTQDGNTHQSGRGWYFSAVSGSSNTLGFGFLEPFQYPEEYFCRLPTYLGGNGKGIVVFVSLEEKSLFLFGCT